MIGGLFALALLVGQATTPAVAPPVLTDVHRLQLQNIAQRIEIAQLKADAAQREFEAARAALATLMQTLKRDGYTLDLSTLTYTPEPKK